MPAPPARDRNCDLGTGTQCMDHFQGICRSDQRHIGQRNEPAIGINTLVDTKGQTGTHTTICIGAYIDLGTRRHKTRLKLGRPGTDNNNQAIHCGPERRASCLTNQSPIWQSGKQFVTAKP